MTDQTPTSAAQTPSPSAPSPQAATDKAPKVIAVASGKGGVGKTWFSITLSHCLARHDRQLVLFDSDLGLANIDIQLGLAPENDLGAALANNQPLTKAVTKYEEGGFDIIAGRSGSGALAALPASRLAEIRAELMAMRETYDNIIIDLGAGVERSIRATSKEADVTLVVTNDEPTSLTDAYTFIKVSRADNPNADIRVVVNSAHSVQEGEKTYQTLLKACRGFLKYEPPLAGIIRRDKKVHEAIRSQTPIVKRSPNADAAMDVEMIAKRLLAGTSF